VDFVIRYERLEHDFAELCARVGLPAIPLPHLKAGLRHSERSYADYYDESSKAIVAERHAQDIRLFGYAF
jgi:hypothetical protein